MKTIAFFCLTLSFSFGLCLALETPPTRTSPQTEETTGLSETSTISSQDNPTAPHATATSGEETGSCPVLLLLSADSDEEEILSRFRDRVLAENERGIIYTRFYYIHSPEITLILLTDDTIKAHAQKILYDILPIAASRLIKGKASIPQSLLDEMDSLINEIARMASPELKDALRMAKSDLIKKTIFDELKIRIIQ